ncbi:hypothetical protein DPEC_G00163760 [Dallia pectoralis]|uniref:Uncharacterized protein n=1 Tax=Dallia pectoralis TaxID=75939 RepID=A0ACC2GHD1_DALPE|nr:hypothetical protein DPEC_G00163760 [Dallia pectoralis]
MVTVLRWSRICSCLPGVLWGETGEFGRLVPSDKGGPKRESGPGWPSPAEDHYKADGPTSQARGTFQHGKHELTEHYIASPPSTPTAQFP